MRARALFLVALLALVSCAVGPDGKFGGGNVVVRADQRPRPARPPEPEIAPKPEPAVAPAVAVANPVDDRLPPPPPVTEHVRTPWKFDVQSYAIDLRVDRRAHAIAGSVTIDVNDAADGLAELPLDAVDMRISRVTATAPANRDVTFAYDGKTLRLPLDEPRRIGTARTFRIEYATHPSRGIYFNDGDPEQVYTQGEMEDSRHWFPCHDAPDDRATSTVTLSSPKEWVVVGGGASPRGGWAAGNAAYTWGTGLPPHVAYLTSWVTGEYEVVESPGIVPLQYVVAKRDAPHAAFDLRKTDDVLRFYGDYTGLPYPYPKYAQICLRNFMWGGMENISATTLTDHTIHPPEWEPARTSTSLVAHEAAHQWFGDWITCADWSDNWLNEGFATYFDALFTEHDEGRDAFLWTMRENRQGALGAMDNERRAMVWHRWASPDEMFDGHAYPGGAARLHMLRHLVGDEQFQGAIRHYVKKCALSCVTTDDFQHAVEEFTGRDLGWFFDQWFRKPGYPVLKIRWKWDEAKSVVLLTVEQTQKAEGGTPEAYRLPLDIAFDPNHLPLTQRRIEIAKRSETYEFPMASEPQCVRVDPGTALLARFDLDLSVDQWIGFPAYAHNPALRQDAAEALAAIVKDDKRAAPDRDKAHAALRDAFRLEEFPQLRAALAGLVASRKDDATAQVLIDAMNSDADLRVRLAAADALHGFADNVKARDALAAHLGNANDLMRASAVAGVAKLKAPGAFETMLAAVEVPGWQSVVRVAALRGIADLGDERGFATLVRFAAPGDNWSRGAAIDVLGRMGRAKPEFRDAVLPYLDDSERHVRQAAADALAKIADPDTMGTLVAHFGTETWPSVKDALRGAVKACRAASVESGRLVSVEAIRIAPIRERHAELRDEADALDASIKTLTGDAKTAAQAKLKSLHDAMAPLKRELDDAGVPVKPKPKPPAAAPAAK